MDNETVINNLDNFLRKALMEILVDLPIDDLKKLDWFTLKPRFD